MLFWLSLFLLFVLVAGEDIFDMFKPVQTVLISNRTGVVDALLWILAGQIQQP